METPRLSLVSIKPEDIKEYYNRLFSQPKVMKKYAEGKPRDFFAVNTLLSRYVEAWQEGNPYGYFSVFIKEPKQFIGTVFVTTRNQPKNIGNLGYIFSKNVWGNGYATEALMPLLYGYIPLVQKRITLHNIEATVREDNSVSCHILKKLGFLKCYVVNKFNTKRLKYFIPVKKLVTLHEKYKIKL